MRIPGEPGTISAAAADLLGVIRALGRDKGDLDRTANNLTMPGHWTGEGAGKFAEATVELDDQLVRFGSACEGAREALAWYAAQLEELQREAEQLNQTAAAQGLTIDDSGVVHGPPVAEPAGSVSPFDSLGQQAQALLQRAKQAADTTRRQLDAARESMFRYDIQPPWATPLSTLGYAYTSYTGAASAYSAAARRSQPLKSMRDDLLKRLERASSGKKARHWEKELKRWEREFGDDLEASENVMDEAESWMKRLPGSELLAKDLGDLGVGVRGLRAIPLAGIGITAIQTGWDLAHGAEPTEELSANATSLVAGAVSAEVATDLAIAGLAAIGATGGAAIPIVAGVAVGMVVAWGVGEGVHWFFHTDAGRAVAHAVDSAVGGAVHAISSGFSHAWHSIFG